MKKLKLFLVLLTLITLSNFFGVEASTVKAENIEYSSIYNLENDIQSETVVKLNSSAYLYDDSEIEEFVLCETNVLTIFRFVGYLLLLVKILVPIIIIVLSMIEFFRAITAGEEKDMQGSLVSLIKKLIAGVIIFIIPTILNFLILLIEDIGETKSDFYNCHICLLDPLSDVCESEAEKTN